MKGLRALVVGVTASLMLAPAVWAADLGPGPRRANSDPVPYEAPFSWTGLYVGGHLGYGWSDIDWQETGFDGSHSADGAIVGGQIGYNLADGQDRLRRRGRHLGQLHRRRQRLLRPHRQLFGVGARSPRPHRLRQPHAVLRDGRRGLGRHRILLARQFLGHATSAGSPAAASSARSPPTCRRGSSISTTASIA